jgi:hypothetical protein
MSRLLRAAVRYVARVADPDGLVLPGAPSRVERRTLMRRTLTIVTAAVAVLGLTLGLTGCDDVEKEADKAKTSVAEFAIRNAAAIAGTAQFKNKGAELEDRLSCKAVVTDDNKATLTCTGVTKDGRPVTLDGTADDNTTEKGSFVGKVDGKVLFSQDCLDCRDEKS